MPTGLPGKSPDVRVLPILYPGKTFGDIQTSPFRSSIEALASRGVVTGVGSDTYDPDRAMTRAEFAVVTTRGLGLTPRANDAFADVTSGMVFAPYIGAAQVHGIVSGSMRTVDGAVQPVFLPGGVITQQEAAVMVANAAKLCGINTSLTTGEADELLTPYHAQPASWAKDSMAFCVKLGILPTEKGLSPLNLVTRGDIAAMIQRLLKAAELM